MKVGKKGGIIPTARFLKEKNRGVICGNRAARPPDKRRIK